MKFRDRNDKLEICKEVRKDLREKLMEQNIYHHEGLPTLNDIAFMIDSYEKHTESKNNTYTTDSVELLKKKKPPEPKS